VREAATRSESAASQSTPASPSIGVPSIATRRDGDGRPAAVPSLHDEVVPDAGLVHGQEFAPGVEAALSSYVYLLVDPRDDTPFFVGRGRGDRCFRQLASARREDPLASTSDRRRRFPTGETIRGIESSGDPVVVEILRHGLSPSEAAAVEVAVADALGIPSGSKLDPQRQTVPEINAALATPVRFKRSHQVVVRRADGDGHPPSYEMVRHGWAIDPVWTDLTSPKSPQWAVAAVDGLVSAVYRIEGWEPASDPDSGFSLVGRPDPVLEARYRGRSVSSYPVEASHLGERALAYVGCGPNWVAPGL
jgi:uncharacterized protein